VKKQMISGKHGEQGLIPSPISDEANIHHEYYLSTLLTEGSRVRGTMKA
jgi:hypothetical protein